MRTEYLLVESDGSLAGQTSILTAAIALKLIINKVCYYFYRKNLNDSKIYNHF
jgi:hypothetical protein